MALQRPRGTRDFGPKETAERQRVATQMRNTFRRFGFQEVQTPTFEELDLFTAKSGEGIVSELYDFTDKGGRHLTLRPELTAPTMRFYYNELTMEPKPLKLFYHANCFRYDRPQKGRYREFWQMGCELVGPDTPEAAAEVVALGVTLLRDTGLERLDVRIGHIGVLRGVLRHLGHPSADGRGGLMRAIDKWDEKAIRDGLAEGGVDASDIDWFLSLRDIRDLDGLSSALARAEEATEALTQLRDVVRLAEAFGVPPDIIQIDPMIARGLDYYTGIVFEMDAPALGAEKQLLGGGAYDLSSVFGGEPVATLGFGLGFDRTLVALDAEGKRPEARLGIDVYVAPIGDAPRERAVLLTTGLRRAGLIAEVDLMRRNPGKNLKAADTRGARYAILLGAREVESGQVGIKDLASGDQVDVPLDRVVEWLTERLVPGPAAEVPA
ncbi:MAG: histidine--tRNA ligase [Euryarchaeota archaeon]|nr:histidine--tRNA ligase [Euryarchaeota archaeon]